MSVINPGVNNKTPEITTKKPSPKAFKRFSGLLKEIVLIRWIVLLPSLFIKKLPIIAVNTMSKTVSRGPMYSLTLRNKYISSIGTDKKRTKKINWFH